MNAAHEGHEDIVRKLILAGAHLAMQNEVGGTALHVAAICNNIQCGIFLAEAGASVRIKYEFSQTPLDVTKQISRGPSSRPSCRKTLCIIGNAHSSHHFHHFRAVGFLIGSSNASGEWMTISSEQLALKLFPTAARGMETWSSLTLLARMTTMAHTRCSWSHSSVNQECQWCLLLVVKMTEEEDAILHQLHRWLTPVALMSTPMVPLMSLSLAASWTRWSPSKKPLLNWSGVSWQPKGISKGCHWGLWVHVSSTVVSPSLKASNSCAPCSRRSPFQSSEPPTHVTALRGSCPRSGHPSQSKQCSCRISQRGSKAMRITYLRPCQPQRKSARICRLLDMLSTFQIRKMLPRVAWCWTSPAFSRTCMEPSSPNPKRLSMSLVSFTVTTWTGSSQT